MKLLVLQGLPGSGKSTWAREFVSKNKNYVRVNRDDLRNMRGDYWIPKQEDLITQWEDAIIIGALNRGFSVVLDATNLNEERNKQRVEMFKSKRYNLKVEYKMFDTPLEDCIKNDLKRPNSVGRDVIINMHNKYLRKKNFAPFYLEAPFAIIVDIDGTVAHMDGRSPYDFDLVHQDYPDVKVIALIKTYLKANPDHHLIFMSGRDDSCYSQTKQWLDKFFGNYNYELHMRETGDNRKDSIVKQELFDEKVRGRFNIDLVFDDRDQVVDMWRNTLGLKCLQVADGNF